MIYNQYVVWEICKFWILQNNTSLSNSDSQFERYVNFEFYKTRSVTDTNGYPFERYANFEFYKTVYSLKHDAD